MLDYTYRYTPIQQTTVTLSCSMTFTDHSNLAKYKRHYYVYSNYRMHSATKRMYLIFFKYI